MAQQLITIAKEDFTEFDRPYQIDHLVERHLEVELHEGWRVRQIVPLNGSGGGPDSVVRGWIVVLLESPSEW